MKNKNKILLFPFPMTTYRLPISKDCSSNIYGREVGSFQFLEEKSRLFKIFMLGFLFRVRVVIAKSGEEGAKCYLALQKTVK